MVQRFSKQISRNVSEKQLFSSMKALKLRSDPEIDVDFTKKMSALSIYGHNFRNSVNINISENSVHARPDVIFKLNNLNINDEHEEECNVNISQQDIDINVSRGISCLYTSNINKCINVPENNQYAKFKEENTERVQMSIFRYVVGCLVDICIEQNKKKKLEDI